MRTSLCRVFVRSSFTYVHSAVDAEELARLVVQLFQIFPVPVEIGSDEQIRPQVDAVSVKGGFPLRDFKHSSRSTSLNCLTCEWSEVTNEAISEDAKSSKSCEDISVTETLNLKKKVAAPSE